MEKTNKIDLKDKKILYELDKDARQSYSKIGKKVGLSKNSVSYRIDNLIKEGVIKQFRTVINSGKLGYFSFRLYLNLSNITLQKEQEIIDFLGKKEIVTWLASMDGKYNLGALILTKDINEMHELWNELLKKYINYIKERLVVMVINSTYFSRAYLIESSKNEYEMTTITPIDNMKLDKKDIEIINNLTGNARMPIVELSAKLKITPKTAISRIKELEKNKIISLYRITIDKDKIGYKKFRIGFILSKITEDKLKDFNSYIRYHPNIIYREEVLGGDDCEIELEVENISHLRKIIEEMRNKFGDMIQDYRIYHIYQEHKKAGFRFA